MMIKSTKYTLDCVSAALSLNTHHSNQQYNEYKHSLVNICSVYIRVRYHSNKTDAQFENYFMAHNKTVRANNCQRYNEIRATTTV